MDRLKVGIIFGGCSEEHPVSVKSAQEVAKNLDPEKYEPFWIGITKSGAWKLCDGPGANWENGSCRPAVLSPDRSVHGLLVLEQGTVRDDQPGRGAARSAWQARRGRRDAGPAGALRHSLRGLRHPEFRPVHGQVPGLHRRQERGNRHAEFLGRHGGREDRSRPAHLSRLRKAGPFGLILRRQQGIRERRTAERDGNRKAVRLEGADRRGRRRQRGRMRHPGERFGSDRRRGRPGRSIPRLLQNPSGE